MKRFFVVTTISFFTLSLYAVDSRLELPHISHLERGAYQRMQSDNPFERIDGLATLAGQKSDLLNRFQIIEDRNGDFLFKQEKKSSLNERESHLLHTGEFVLLHEGDELPQEFYPCIILGRTKKPTREELKTLYMPYTFVDHDDRARSEGSDDAESDSDGSSVEKAEERAIASEGSEDAEQEQAATHLSTEEDEVEPTPCSRKRKRNASAVRRAMKRSAVVRRNSITIPCEIGTETLVTRVSKKKYKVQVWPLI